MRSTNTTGATPVGIFANPNLNLLPHSQQQHHNKDFTQVFSSGPNHLSLVSPHQQQQQQRLLMNSAFNRSSMIPSSYSQCGHPEFGRHSYLPYQPVCPPPGTPGWIETGSQYNRWICNSGADILNIWVLFLFLSVILLYWL